MELARQAGGSRAWIRGPALGLACVALALAVAAPIRSAGHARLTSDESLYTAEALNIAAGKGLTYTSGLPISHRAPLYPALLALEFKARGLELDSAYPLTAAAIVANALLVFFLARSLFGNLAGMIAGTVAASSPYLTGLGTTLFLDGIQSTLILSALLACWRASEHARLKWHIVGGCLLGLAFLVKESAILFLPLPLIVPLLAGRQRGWRAGVSAWTAAFVATTGWWWVWVVWHTQAVYQLGPIGDHRTWLVLAGTAISALGVGSTLWRSGKGSGKPPTISTRLAAVALLAAWSVLFVAGLESRSWQHLGTYLDGVPDYAVNVFLPAFRPAPLFAAAWAWAAVRAWRGERQAGLLLAAGALVMPFVAFVASRGLSLRDVLPFIYLSCVALAGAAARLVAWGEKLSRDQGTPFPARAGLVAVLASTLLLAAVGLGRVERAPATTPDGDWNNPLPRGVAAWIAANVEPGTPIMSTRLYYSHLYFLTGGRYPIRQLPTAEVTLRPEGPSPLERRSALFRWEGPRLAADSSDDVWLYLAVYPEKGYYVGLAESDLLDELRRNGTPYFVLSVSDGGFSSPALVPYFDANPGFSLVYEERMSDSDAVRVYRVRPEALGPRGRPAAVSFAARRDIERRLGSVDEADAFLRRLSPAGFDTWPW